MPPPSTSTSDSGSRRPGACARSDTSSIAGSIWFFCNARSNTVNFADVSATAAGHTRPDPRQRRRVPGAAAGLGQDARTVCALAAGERAVSRVAAHHLRLPARQPAPHLPQHVRALHVRQRARVLLGRAALPRLLLRVRARRGGDAAARGGSLERGRAGTRRLGWHLRRAARLCLVLPAAAADRAADTDSGSGLAV